MLIWRAHLLPPGWEAILVLPLLASLWLLSGVDQNDDGYFLGFRRTGTWSRLPLRLETAGDELVCGRDAGGIVAADVCADALSLSVAARPIEHGGECPRRRVGVDGGVDIGADAGRTDRGQHRAARGVVSLYFPIFYMAASWIVTMQVWRKKRRRSLPVSIEKGA